MFESVFNYFYNICKIPHQSGNTKAISDYCKSFAISHKLSYIQDKYNNIIIFKPASDKAKNNSPVILEGHLDMVCVKEDDCEINFQIDGLDISNDGEFIKANGTSLGGDDGIAIAFALAVLADDTIEHPPIEAVFTVDEETGMDGARTIDVSKLKGKMLINIDSEDEGTLLVSCAGGARADLTKESDLSLEVTDAVRIYISNFTGGHSGTEIDKGRENAILFLADLISKYDDICLSKIEGGTADNAIPTSCEVIIKAKNADDLIKKIQDDFNKEKAEKLINDKSAELKAEKIQGNFSCLNPAETRDMLKFITKCPNGIIKMSDEIDGLVQTSLNLGMISMKDGVVTLSFAVRSSVNEEKESLLNRLQVHCEKYNAKSKFHGSYPAWEYKSESVLRDIFVKKYKEQTGKDMRVTAIHAGVECGIFSGKISNLDCVSMGPDIFDIHSTNEKLSVHSSERTFNLIINVLKELSNMEEI